MLHNSRVALFGRDADAAHLIDRLETQSVLLVGPRRIGKTELLRYLCDEPPRGFTSVRIDLEGLRDVGGAVERIRDACDRRDLAPRKVIERLRELRRVEVAGVLELERDSPDIPSVWRGLEELMEAAIGKLDKGARLVLMLDEVPWWLDGLRVVRPGDGDDPATQLRAGDGRVREALAQLRYLRQRDGLAPQLRMVVTGSVGIANLAAAVGAPAELNDLEPYELRPLEEHAGSALFEAELAGRGIGCTPEVAIEAQRIAGGSPHWIKQLAAKIAGGGNANAASLAEAVEQLLSPRMRHLFHDEGHAHLLRRHAELAPMLKAMLASASGSDEGVPRAIVLAAGLQAGLRGREAAERATMQLVDEFYFELRGDRLRFSNPLLRRWWQRYGDAG
jgi:hypothetical protein